MGIPKNKGGVCVAIIGAGANKAIRLTEALKEEGVEVIIGDVSMEKIDKHGGEVMAELEYSISPDPDSIAMPYSRKGQRGAMRQAQPWKRKKKGKQ